MRVVVGTDGSDGGLAAVRWALDFCRDRREPGAELDLVHVYSGHEAAMPLFVPTSISAPRHVMGQPDALEPFEASTMVHRAELEGHFHHDAEQVLVSALRGAGGAQGVQVTLSALPGHHHARTLIEHAAGADLLVVGARGHGGLMSHVLGSVSTHCVNHASCPVVVVRR
jgi:nucleotide-binding universal stress UspA family protein